MQRVWPTAAAVWLCVSSALSLTPRPLSRRTLLDTSAAGVFAGGLSCIPQVSNAAAAAAALEPGPPGLRLTRADLSRKLSRLPVFYVKATSGAPVLEDDMGKFYVNAADAEAALTRSGIKGGEVGLVFLNEVYFPLIMKTAKLDIFPGSSVVGKAVAAGLADKLFRIIPDQTEVANGKKRGGVLGSGELGDDQIPLYLVDRISFAGANPGDVIKPMFLSEMDAVDAYTQMVDEKKKAAKPGGMQLGKVDLPDEPTVSVITLESFLSGSVIGNVAGSKRLTGEAKVLELFPAHQSVADAQKIISDGYLR